jgi:hypothetical protein
MSMPPATLENQLRAPTGASDVAPTLKDYGVVTLALLVFAGWLTLITQQRSGSPVRGEALLAPLLTLVLLVGLVWLVMLVFRNYAILKGLISGTYYKRFDVDPPPDWVERPARTFNNLMQVPPLFYLLCVLMLLTQRVDGAQLALAWTFVAARWLHAFIYMIWNYLPARFGAFVASCVTLCVLYVRFALQVTDLVP